MQGCVVSRQANLDGLFRRKAQERKPAVNPILVVNGIMGLLYNGFTKKKKKVTWVISPLSLVELWANGRGPSCGDVENTASGCKWMITVRRPCFTVLENSYSIV